MKVNSATKGRLSVYDSCNCDAFVYWRYTGTIDLCSKPDSGLIVRLNNDTLNERFVHMTILGYNKSHFLVDIHRYPDSIDTSYIGWIRKGKYIGSFARFELEYMDLELFDTPEGKVIEKRILWNWKSGVLTTLECKNDWVLVEVDYEGKRINGWINKVKICPNSWTTCT